MQAAKARKSLNLAFWADTPCTHAGSICQAKPEGAVPLATHTPPYILQSCTDITFKSIAFSAFSPR